MTHREFHPSELGEMTDPLESAAVLRVARELERLDGGPIRPSDGFTDRVLAAIGNEPLPAPMAVAGLAARHGRFGAMAAALRDTWHVAWSGGRPLAVRAQAMAFVLLLVVAAGSVGAVTTVGAINALFPAISSPAPTDPDPSPMPAPTTEPTRPPERTATPDPSRSQAPTETAKPGTSSKPAETTKPHETVEPDHTARPDHTATPEPTETPEPTDDGGGGSDDGGGGHGGGQTPEP